MHVKSEVMAHAMNIIAAQRAALLVAAVRQRIKNLSNYLATLQED